jgi:hypothetical protein
MRIAIYWVIQISRALHKLHEKFIINNILDDIVSKRKGYVIFGMKAILIVFYRSQRDAYHSG